MNIRPFQDKSPIIDNEAYIDPMATVIGDVHLGQDSSIWPMAVARGDVNYIRIGNRSNIQDGAILHVSHDGPFSPGGSPLIIGNEVTVGHQAMLHGTTIQDRVLIGMQAIVLDNTIIESNTIIGAGSLIPPGKTCSSGLWLGSPAMKVRELTAEEIASLPYYANHYVKLKNKY